MGKSLFGANTREANGEIDQIAIDYKLKLIAFQDELFQSRKKLQDSDKKMADLQKKLDDYVRNKENQIAEVMFTAHMNAQRIEVQTRSQTDYFILEMEEEMQHKQKELELLKKKTNRFTTDTQSDNVIVQDSAVCLQIVQEHIRSFKEQIETTKTMEVSLKGKKPSMAAKIAEITIDNKELATEAKLSQSSESKELDSEVLVEQSLEDKQIAVPSKVDHPLIVIENKVTEPFTNRKRRVVTRKAEKSGTTKDQNITAEVAVRLVEVKDRNAASNITDSSRKDLMPVAAEDYTVPNSPNLSPSQAEPNERMRLDAFVDARYYEIVDGQRQMQHHALQVTIEVDVPPDNYSVRYTKVSSDVVSTLMQYDNIVLNDVFPFNFIEPNPQNISMYFFNCLEDMLSLMDLELHMLTVLELPDLKIQVNSRNTKLNNFLHQSENVFDNIRESLIPCVEAESEDNSALKGTLKRILKKRA